MADDTKKTTAEDIENAKTIKQLLDDQNKTRKDILDSLLKQAGASKKISDLLKEDLDKQADFLTIAEIQQQLSDKRLEALQEQKRLLSEQEEIEERRAALDTRLTEARTAAANLTGAELAASLALQGRLVERLGDLDDELSNITDKQQELKIEASATVASTQAAIKAEEERAAALEKTINKQGNISSIIGNQIEQTFGLKDATDSLGDVLIDNVFNSFEKTGTGLTGLVDTVKLSFANLKKETGDTFEALGIEAAKRFTAQNIFKNLKGQLGEFGDSFKSQISEVADKFIDMPVAFAQQTGQSKELGEELKGLTKDLSKSGFLIGETDAAFNSLISGFNKFTLIDAEARAGLAEDAAILNRLGVNTSTFASSIENLTTGMGLSTGAASKFSQEMVNFGRTIGESGNKMLEQLNDNFDLLATHGKEKGSEVFKALAKEAKAAGVSIKELVQIGQRFDTFEGAMKSAGKLNFILGGPLVNSMEMLNATEERRIELLRESLKNSGKSFDQLGRRGKEALANTLGVSTAIAERLFNDDNIRSIEEATEALEGSQMSLEELRQQGIKNLTQDQKAQLAQELQITTNETLLETFESLNQIIMDFKTGFAPIIGIIGGVAMVINQIAAVVPLLAAGFTKLGIAGKIAAIGTNAAFLPITLTLLAIMAVIGILYLAFEHFGIGVDEIMEGIKIVFKAVARVMIEVMHVSIQAILIALTGGLVLLFAGFAEILEYIPGAGDLAASLKKFSPMHIVGGLREDAIAAIDSFEVGTNFAPGGMSLVGEAGPELMSVPRGSAITPAEQTKTMMSTLSTFNNIMTNADTIENMSSIVNNATNVTTTNNNNQQAAKPQDIKLNLVLKIDEREIAKVARDVTIDTMQRSLEVSV
tara:strand:+ start:10145 stop:12778 length:2634 start_codon:yes stop_codon:yes gene_type:complete